MDHVTTLRLDHVGFEGPGWLCKLSEHFMVLAQQRNLEVPALGVGRHFARVLAVVTMEPPHLRIHLFSPTFLLSLAALFACGLGKVLE